MAQPECASTSLKYQARQIERLSSTLARMRLEGISEISTPYRAVSGALRGVRTQWGYKVPRTITALLKLFGLSPGTITLWFDNEAGYFSEARERPGAPPIYKAVSDEVALAILKEELSPEVKKILMTPEEYYGE